MTPRALHVFPRLNGMEPTAVPAVLLEGAWQDDSKQRWSLDEVLTSEFAWLDDEALALVQAWQPCNTALAAVAHYDTLALRYFLLKLLRLAAFFQRLGELGLASVREVFFHPISADDVPYAAVLEQIAQSRGWEWNCRPAPRASCDPPLRYQATRRMAAGANRWLDGAFDLFRFARGERGPVLLCGQPSLLDPVCEELCRRSVPVCWFWEDFAFRSWFRWRPQGVRQCNSHRHSRTLPLKSSPPLQRQPKECGDHRGSRLIWRGIDLEPAVTCWARQRCRQTYRNDAALQNDVTRQFDRMRPAAILLDEEVTPLKRVLLRAAQQIATPVAVIQHGAPFVKLASVPLLAERLFVWGEASRQQYEEWGVPRERIRITGSPKALAARRRFVPRRERAPATILLIATTSPRPERPEPVGLQFTRQSYRRMLQNAAAAVAALQNARLLVKLHPRERDSGFYREIFREFPGLEVEFIDRDCLHDLWPQCDAVLSCPSTGGWEAAYYGLPVVQLLPANAVGLPSAAACGMQGDAHTAEDIRRLLEKSLAAGDDIACRPERLFAATGAEAAGRIADELTQLVADAAMPSRARSSRTISAGGVR